MGKKKNIPPRNYLILFFIVFLTFFGTLYFFEWKSVQEQTLTAESYLISTNTVSLTLNTLEELEIALLETPTNVFVFTGFTGDTDEYYLEKDLKSIIDDYSLADSFYYLDITDLIDDENFLDNLSDILDINVKSYPAIVYITEDEDGGNKIESTDEIFEASDFLKLLEMYEFEESN